ncbi:PREDICTED: cytoglobin-2-like isoform X2 [Branchiostoma belcheri]|uniref:Cytoglobin-2-like isoform X2 n=2 Tax=Branchiostoma belcheri TaxID=7741 RepID=A0A6P4Z0M1_BRABE|nr:PREDICTED: cytoglobin-2-like isoform X2 [Branchiostoma belcheri]
MATSDTQTNKGALPELTSQKGKIAGSLHKHSHRRRDRTCAVRPRTSTDDMGAFLTKPFSLVGRLLWKVLFSWWVKQIETPNDVTGLTPTQSRLVKESWKTFLSKKRENGFVIFRVLFTDYPITKKLFKGVEQMDMAVPGQLENSISLRAHVTRFMHSFDTYMECLDEPEDLKQLLYDTGKGHLRHNIKPEYFDVLETVLMKSLRIVFGSKFTPQLEEAWQTAYSHFKVPIKQGLEDEIRKAADTSVTVTVE